MPRDEKSDPVFGAYSITPTDDGEFYELKTAHLDRDTGEMLYSSCQIDAEIERPLSNAVGMQINACGEEFRPDYGSHKEAFERAVNSEEAIQFEQENNVDREVYATMVVLEEHYKLKNNDELVKALEARQSLVVEANAKNTESQQLEAKEALCQPPRNYEDKVVATVMTQDSLHVLTEDGHMFEASEMALEGKGTLGAKERSEAIHEFKANLQAKGDVADFHAIGGGRNMAGAAMDLQTDPKTAGTKFSNRLHLEDSREPLIQDLGMNFEMSDER